MAKKITFSDELNNIDLIVSEEDKLQIANICKFIRKTFKATQKQMADKLSVNLSTYRDWEYGRFVPKSFPAINLGLLYLHAKQRAAIKEKISQNSTNK